MASQLDEELIPSFLFSAAELSERDRFDAWQHEVAQLFDVAPAAEPRRFEGTIQGHLMDGMLVATNRFSGQEFRRDRRLVAKTGLDAYLVQLYTGGGFDGYADAAEMSVRAGDVCVFDLTDTLSTQASQSSTVSLVIPKLLIDRHWHARAPANGLVIQGRTALGQLMGAHLAALSKAVLDMTPGEAPLMAETTARLTAGCLNHFAGGDAMANGALRQALYERAIGHIRANLQSQDLSPDTICKALKVSRPHLYRAFTDKGGVMRCLLEQRLRVAFGELTNPALRAETIGSIAFRCGFASDSHFTRLFRETFGVRPSDVRDAPSLTHSQAGDRQGLPAWLSSPAFVGH